MMPPSPATEPRVPVHSSKFHPGHRKSRSLSAKAAVTQVQRKSLSLPSRTTAPYVQGIRLLLDDSVLEESPCTSSDGSVCSRLQNLELGREPQDTASDQESFWPVRTNPAWPRESEEVQALPYHTTFACEGCLRRKTLIKDSKKPTVASWTRYWMALWGTNLLYYPAKSLRGTERNAFKSNPSKMTSIVGWIVVMGDNPLHPDAFQLTDTVRGSVYKFRAGSQSHALQWCRHLSEASKRYNTLAPVNLMSFD